MILQSAYLAKDAKGGSEAALEKGALLHLVVEFGRAGELHDLATSLFLAQTGLEWRLCRGRGVGIAVRGLWWCHCV